MIWLHTYSGLVIGWLLFAIFVTGTLSYFTTEITHWMKPELHSNNTINQPVNRAIRHLQQHAVNEKRWRILLPNERSNALTVQWGDRKNRQKHIISENNLAPKTARETEGGQFFKSFHYTLQLRQYGGRYIAGIAAMFMLVAVFSGIFTHRRFFRDFFTLRKGKLNKTLTDFHAIFGIITIPFCIVICSSAIMIYATYYNPWSANHYYSGGQKELNKHIIPSLTKLSDNSPSATPIKDFTLIQNQINKLWQGTNQIARITFEQPYHQNGRVIVERVKTLSLSNQAERLVFSAITSEQLKGYSEHSTAMQIRRIFYGLHEAKFAEPFLRWILFTLGVISSALIGTGLIMWLNKRLEKAKIHHAGHFIVARLNLCGILGLIIAVLSYFYANRIIPFDVADRANIEVQVFFITWLISAVHAVVRPINKAWIEQLCVASFICLTLPIVDIFSPEGYLLPSIVQGNMSYLSFTLVILLCGFVLMALARWRMSIAVRDNNTNNLTTTALSRI